MAEIDQLLARPKAYYNIDGVVELGSGFMFLAFALLQWLQMQAPQSIWHQVHMLFIYWGVMFLIIHYGSRAIKKHITYPRTGFVQYRRDTRWLGFVGAMFGSVVGVVFLSVFRAHGGFTAGASLMGLLIAASYAYGIARKVRWKWTVVCAMALGSLAIAMLPAELVEAPARHSGLTTRFPARAIGTFWLTTGVYGTLLLISGAASFILYFRRTQPPAQDGQ